MEQRHEKQSRDIQNDISTLLSNQKDFIYLDSSGGTFGGLLPILSPGFDSSVIVSVYPKTELELETIMGKKLELREQLKEQILDLFENNLEKKHKKLRLVLPPRKPGGFTFDLKLSGDSNAPSPEEFKINGRLYEKADNDPLMYAESLLSEAMYQALAKKKEKMAGGVVPVVPWMRRQEEYTRDSMVETQKRLKRDRPSARRRFKLSPRKTNG